MAKAYTFVDIPQPTSPSATAVAGGSLAANTTYYYRIIKTHNNTSSWQGKSIPSDSFSVTTDTTNKTARITFTCPNTSQSYKIFRSTTPDGFLNVYTGALNFYPTDATYNSGGTVTFDDNGTATIAVNQFCENKDAAHGRLFISGSTSSDQFTINDLYNEDVANGWGVILKLDENTFKVNTHLVSGAQQYWTDFEKTIILADGVTAPGRWTLGRVTTGTNRTFGGCNIIIKSTWLSDCSFTFLTAYRSSFIYKHTILPSGEDIQAGIGLAGGGYSSGIMQDCTVDRFRNFTLNNASCIARNCIFSRFDNLLSASVAVFDGVKCLTGSRVWQISGSSTNITGRGVYTESSAAVLVINAGGSSLTLIDSISDGGILVNSASTGFKLFDKFSYNLNVTDNNGTPINGASFKVYDKNNTLVADTSTDISGSISEQFITRRDKTVDGMNQGSFTNYSPFTVVISKTGYETYTEIVSYTASNPVVKTVSLKPVKKIRQTEDGKTLFALKAERGSSAKLLEI